MPRSHHLLRNILIVYKIKNHSYISFKELEEQIVNELLLKGLDNVGISARTLQRDIKSIRDIFEIDIQYDKYRDGYYIEEDGIKPVLYNFLESCEIFNSLNSEHDSDFILSERHSPKGVNHLSPLISAIKNSSQVIFSYLKFGETAESNRQLEPYLLKEFRGRWYLIGRMVEEHCVKIFGLDRINELKVSDVHFHKDDSIDLAKLFESSFGIYSSENYQEEEVVLSFSGVDANYLKSLPLHHSQEILKDEETEFVIRLRLCITYDFIMEILSRSWSLKVIAPDSLREKVSEIWRLAIARNQLIGYSL